MLFRYWQLITQSPEQFKGGSIWNVIVDIHGAVQAIGLALLVLFFVIGVMKTCGSFAEVKKPEHALKLFIRFALAKGVVTYGLELMMALFNIVQGLISTIMNAAGFGSAAQTVLPQEIVTAVEDCGFFESIPLWAVTLIGGLFMVELPEGKMKSREGTVVDADDLMEEMVSGAREVSMDLGKLDGLTPEEINEISETVGLGDRKSVV